MFLDEKREGEAQVECEPWRSRLMEAADLIRKKGWFSLCPVSAFYAGDVDRRGSHCALTAIYDRDNFHNSDTADTAAKKLCEYLRLEPLPPPYDHGSPIPAWNDATGRTVEEVIAALEGAARS